MAALFAPLWIVLAAGAEFDGDRAVWKVQHALGSAQLSEKKGEFETAVAKIEEAEAVMAEWKAHIREEAKRTAAGPPAGPQEPESVPDPVDFFVNRTHVPDKCPVEAKEGSVLKIHWVGKLMATDKVFGSSFHTGSMPQRLVLGGKDVIEGWNKGLLGMCTGERRRLFVPWTMAFGAAGQGAKVPPHSNLRYDIELVEQAPPKDEV